MAEKLLLRDIPVKIGSFRLTRPVKIGYNRPDVSKYYILCFAHMACCGVVDFCMAVYQAQDPAYANCKSRSANDCSFRCFEGIANHGGMTTPVGFIHTEFPVFT